MNHNKQNPTPLDRLVQELDYHGVKEHSKLLICDKMGLAEDISRQSAKAFYRDLLFLQEMKKTYNSLQGYHNRRQMNLLIQKFMEL